MENNYLQHYGVLGMKWGVRRSKSRSGKKRDRRSTWSDDAKTTAQLKKKKPSELSNAELKKLNERIQLEQSYSRLNPSKVKKGLAFVGAVAGTMGTVMSLYNNSNQIVSAGKAVGGKIIDVAGNMVLKDLARHL